MSGPRSTARGRTIHKGSLVIVVARMTLAFFGLIANSVMPVFRAAVLRSSFPLQRPYWRGLVPRSLAAPATMLTIIALVVIPRLLIGLAMSHEAAYLHHLITSGAIDVQAPLRLLRQMTSVASD